MVLTRGLGTCRRGTPGDSRSFLTPAPERVLSEPASELGLDTASALQNIIVWGRVHILPIQTEFTCCRSHLVRVPISDGLLKKSLALFPLFNTAAVVEENVQRLKQRIMAPQDVSRAGRVQMKELATMFLSEDENFLLLFRQETPLDSSVEFMQIWRKYDADSSGFISAVELRNFLRDLFLHHKKAVPEAKLDEYTGTMMKIFDKNKDGRLDLNDLARILALQENFLLQFKMDACSTEERKRDFEKIFAHYDVSKTGALEGPEVDGFVKDMMELVQPSISGADLDKFREILLRHCDVNKDGKIQKSELALCLGLKINP
ncbi:secretagogin [Puma concolor]|uniref:Secretagogin n=1 Tax=Puma concolor TaxID=9696 RepID=A0A6P6HBQ4_PUMCO|nr:secretagogin [Puma concolor]